MAKKIEIDDDASRVETLLLLPGNGGCNQAKMIITDTDPATSPGLHLVALDADGPLLKSRFVDVDPSTSYGKRLGEWLDADRFDVHQFGRKRKGSAGIDETQEKRKLFGAGGDIEEGRRIVQESFDDVKAMMKGKDLIINWGAGGGGIGTSGLEMIAEAAKDLKIPLFSILITPFKEEGKKVGIADALRKKLREYGSLLVVRNESLPAQDRNAPQEEVYHNINLECRHIFRNLREITQNVGTNSNVDLADVLKGWALGKDQYVGSYDVRLDQDASAPTDINPKEIAERMMSHQLQLKGINAKGLFFCFPGPWMMSQMQDIVAEVQQLTNFPVEGIVKWQDHYTTKEMWCSVLVFGSYDSNEQTSQSTIAAVADGPMKVVYLQVVNGRRKEFTIPSFLDDRWRALTNKQRLDTSDYDAAVALCKEISTYDPTGAIPEIPASIKAFVDRAPLRVVSSSS